MRFALEKLDPEAVYLYLPIPLQNLACSLVGLRTEGTRYAGEFPRLLEETIARTHWRLEDITRFRDQKLASMVERAQTSPLYRERFGAAGIAPSDISSIEDLASLPILTKREVQQHRAALAPTVMPSSKIRIAHTSGTTGGALRFPVTMEAIQEQWAVWWRYRDWHGIGRGTWCGLFAGRSIVPSRQQSPPFWRTNRPGHQLLFSGYHMSRANLPAYIGELRRRRPVWLHGYPSLLAVLAAYLVDSRADLGYDVRWVTTGAENLLPHQSKLIERAFGVRPTQHYGLAEGVANISQCERGSLHVDEDFAAVELIPLGTNGLHRIIGTNLTNPAAPLLRYDTQDLATIEEGSSCACGRPGRVVQKVDGRLEDYVVLRNGTRVGRMDHIFKDMTNIQEAQIHQARRGEMTIRVVRGQGYGDVDEQELLRETAKRVRDDMDITIEYLNSLPRTQIGKLRFVVSELPEASIEGVPASLGDAGGGA